jgi:threonine synthase
MVFAPTSAEAGKLLQTLVYGAKVVRTRGSFRNAILRCEAACAVSDYHDLTIETNPYALEGEKTTGFEIADQLGWEAPDFVVVPAGTGSNLYSIWKGFKELRQAGLISETPRMVAAQAAACAPIFRAFREGGGIRTLGMVDSVAASIAMGDPVNGEAALAALRESKGLAYAVEDREMVEAVNLLGAREGVFAEPASAATICAAGSMADDGVADPSDTIVCVVTGSGLKVPDGIARTLKPRLSTTWDLVAMDQKALGTLGGTKIRILEILETQASYGYSIWRQLDVRFGETISLQAIYQHLEELRKMDLVRSEEGESQVSRGRRRKYFALSPRGRRILTSLDSIRDSLLPERGRAE